MPKVNSEESEKLHLQNVIEQACAEAASDSLEGTLTARFNQIKDNAAVNGYKVSGISVHGLDLFAKEQQELLKKMLASLGFKDESIRSEVSRKRSREELEVTDVAELAAGSGSNFADNAAHPELDLRGMSLDNPYVVVDPKNENSAGNNNVNKDALRFRLTFTPTPKPGMSGPRPDSGSSVGPKNKHTAEITYSRPRPTPFG